MSLRKRCRWREGWAVQLSGGRPVFRDRGLRPSCDDDILHGILASGAPLPSSRSYERPIQWTSFAATSRPLRAVHLPELPPFCAGRSATPATIRCATSSNLPNAPPDDRQVPDLAFAFYDRMVVFDNVDKTIVVVAWPRLDRPARPWNRLTRMPSGGLMPWSSNWPRDRRPRPGRYPARRRRQLDSARTSPSRVRAGGREVRRIHSRGRHFPGRDQPAAGSAASARIRLRSTGHCVW